MSAVEIVNLIAAIIVSPVVYLFLAQLIKRPEWPPLAKAVLAIALSGIVAVAQSWISGDLAELIDNWGSLTAAQALGYWGIVYATGQVIYNAIGGREFMIRLAEWPR